MGERYYYIFSQNWYIDEKQFPTHRKQVSQIRLFFMNQFHCFLKIIYKLPTDLNLDISPTI